MKRDYVRTKKETVAGRRYVPRRKRPSRVRFLLWKPALVLALLLCLWLFYSSVKGIIFGYLASPVAAQYGSVEFSSHTTVLAVRAEKVVPAPYDGELKRLVAEGDMVRAGSAVAEVLNPAAQRQAETRLNQLNEEISRFDTAQGGRLEQLKKEYESAGKAVMEKLQSLRAVMGRGDAQATYQAASELSAVSGSRRATQEEIKKVEEERANLERERIKAQAALASHSTVIVAPATGLVSFKPDGLEERLTPERVADLSMKDVMSLQGKTPENSGDTRSGEPLFKVVDPLQTILVGSLPVPEVQEMERKPAVVVRIEGEELPAVLFHVGNVDRNDYRVFSLRLQKPLTRLLPRRLDVEIVERRWEGIIVPRRALVESGDGAAVYAVKEGKAVLRRVRVIGGDRSRVVVEGISEGTRVVSRPYFVREGARIQR